MNNSLRMGVLGALILCALIPVLSYAADFRAGDQPSFPSGETVNDDLYMVGGNVTSAGNVRGDLVGGGGSVLVSGPVSGDVLVGGGNVTILGEVADDVRAGGGNIVIQGVVRGDVVLGGGQINLSGSRIGGDVAIGGGSIRIDAAIGGDVKIGGGDVYLNAPVAGNVQIDTDKLTLGPKANITGTLTYSAREAATMETGAVVKGKTTFNERKGDTEKAGALAAFITVWLIAKFFMALVGAFALAYLFKRYSRELVATAAMQPLMEFGRGIIFLIVLPIFSIILLATVIGIPLGIMGLLAFVLTMIFVCLATPIVIGSIVHKLIWKPAGYEVNWKTILLGVALYFVLGLIPFVGWIVTFIATMITLGAALNIKWGVAKEWR